MRERKESVKRDRERDKRVLKETEREIREREIKGRMMKRKCIIKILSHTHKKKIIRFLFYK